MAQSTHLKKQRSVCPAPPALRLPSWVYGYWAPWGAVQSEAAGGLLMSTWEGQLHTAPELL